MGRFTVTIEEAAVVLGISRSLAYRQARAGAFPVPVVSIGRRLVVPLKKLEDLLGVKFLTKEDDVITPLEGPSCTPAPQGQADISREIPQPQGGA